MLQQELSQTCSLCLAKLVLRCEETHRQLMRSWNPCSQKQPEVASSASS